MPWNRSSIPFPATDLIEAVSPFSASPVQNSAGVWTIGYGSPLGVNGQAVTATTQVVSLSQAANLLTTQMPALLKAVAEIVWVPVQEYEAAALISLIADQGESVLVNSPLIAMLNAGRADLAVQQFSRWVMVADTTAAGGMSASLSQMRRRAIEAKVFAGIDVAVAVTAVTAMAQADLLALKTAGDTLASTWMAAPTAVSVTGGGS